MQCSPLMIPLCQLLFDFFLFANLYVFREGRFWNWFPKSRFANLFICTFRSDEAIVSRSPQNRNVFNWLPSLITSQSSTKPTYWIQLQICPKLCQWSQSRGQIFGLNIQIRQDDMTLSITKLVGHCLIHFSLEARSVFFCRHHLTEHYSVQRGIGGVFCRIHHLCEQSNCPVTTRLSSVAIKSCHRSSFPPHFAPFSKHSLPPPPSRVLRAR